MTIKADKLENTILALLRLYAHGKGSDSMAGWCNRIEQKLGERPDDDQTIAALKHLRDNGLVRLVKYSRQLDGWYDYTKGEVIDGGLFFYQDTFWIIITDEGRARWDQAADPIGFQRPA